MTHNNCVKFKNLVFMSKLYWNMVSYHLVTFLLATFSL